MTIEHHVGDLFTSTAPAYPHPPVIRFTFGGKYRHEDHPTLGPVDPNGWLEVWGLDHERAHALMMGLTADPTTGVGLFATSYDEDHWDESHHSGGCFARILFDKMPLAVKKGRAA